MKIRNKTLTAASLAIVAAVILILERLRLPQDTLLWQEIQNAGHTPSFGMIALAILAISKSNVIRWETKPFRHYALSVIVTLTLGASIELSQIAGPRDADAWDFVRNVAGVLSFLGIYLPFDRRSLANSARMFRLRKIVFASAVAALIASAIPFCLLSTAYLHRARIFPSMLTFDSALETEFVSTAGSDLKLIKSPQEWAENDTRVGRVTFDTVGYPSLVIDEPPQNWRGYTSFAFEVYSPLDTICTLAVRIEDKAHNQEYEDRFNAAMRINPELNEIAIPLSEIERGPANRPLNMDSIGPVQFFMVGLRTKTVLYFDNIRLQ